MGIQEVRCNTLKSGLLETYINPKIQRFETTFSFFSNGKLGIKLVFRHTDMKIVEDKV